MPQYGTGIVPGSGTIATELTAVTRRAFIPSLIDQVYHSTPLMSALFANTHFATGGVSSLTQPVRGNNATTAQWTDYGGSFSTPQNTPSIQNAEWNLCAAVTPIQFLGMEGLVQDSQAIIPIIEARMDDAGNQTAQIFASALYYNPGGTDTISTPNQTYPAGSSGGNPLALMGLPAAIDDGTNMTTYGGINRSTYTWWKAKRYAAGTVAPTRDNVLQYIGGTFRNGSEMPNMGVMGVGTWLNLAQDFISQERYNITPGSAFSNSEAGAQAAFTALSVGGVPIYADPYCPEGELYLWNTAYLNLWMHESAAFNFSGFQSTIPNSQIGYVGALMSIAQLTNTKPKASSITTGYTYLTI